MRPQSRPARNGRRGFSLVELAIVMAIVSFLLAGLMFTLSAQTEQRNIEETRRRLEMARDLVLAFTVVNGRLPCPARSTSSGAEARDTVTGQCTSGGVEDYYGGTLSGGATGGLLPAQTIGYQQVDSAGFAVDAWQNRIRYAVAKSVASGTCSGTFVNPHFVNAANMKANGIACQPGDLLVCKSATGITTSACGGGANQIMTTGLVVAIFFSTGKNGASGSGGADEAANLDVAVGSGNPIFVYHTPSSSSATNGEFDDQMIWITVGELYGKLIAAGQLP
jgi:prepilin-type N-terminal cleavage/methylation domain-containing protein